MAFVRQKRTEPTKGASMLLRIRDLRKQRGLTIQALADAIGVTKSHVSEMERGVKPISSRHLESIARALGCCPADLIASGAMDPEILDHIRLLERLSPEDRAAVVRHAESLARRVVPH